MERLVFIRTTRKERMVSLKSLLGKEVITSDGVYVGEVVDVEISEDWRVAKLIVRLERDAAKALGSRLALRPRGAVDVSKVKGLGDYVTLSVNFSELKEAVELL